MGLLFNRTRIIGLALGKNSLVFLNKDFSVSQALTFLKFPFDKIWQNAQFYFILYPLVHIVFATILYFFLIRTHGWVRVLLLTILVTFFMMQVAWIFGADPRVVLAVTK